MAIEAISSIPHAERIAIVSKIQRTIPRERIRVQIGQDNKAQEMWGFVWLDRLPFCFRAWHSLVNRRLPFLENGLSGVQTNWGFVHAPYHPLDFTAPVFTVGITEDDMVYMLKGLKVKHGNIELARQDGKISELFIVVSGRRKRVYQQFQTLYTQDVGLRMAYSTAVSITCDEVASRLFSTP